jgi:quinol monooxygenase YgiN
MSNIEQLTVVATIVAKSGSEKTVEEALLRLIPPTRLEAGFVQYDLHRAVDDARVFVFVEKWESRALHAEHMKSPHLAAYQQEVEGLVESWDVKLLTRIG